MFERKETVESPTEAPAVFEPVNAKPSSSAAGPLSFAAIVARKPKRDQPKPVEVPQFEEEVTPSFPEPIQKPVEPEPVIPSPKPSIESKSPVKPIGAPSAPITFSSQHDAVEQSLTDQLKNDLGLGASFSSSFHSTASAHKELAPSPKAVIEWASGIVAPSEVAFDFSAGTQKEVPVPEPKPTEYYKPQEVRLFCYSYLL